MNEYLNMDELKEWLKISRATVDRWRKAGLPCYKVGRVVRFKREDVDAWLKEKTQLKTI